MIELSTQLPQTTVPVSGPAAPGGAAGGFVQLLAAFLDAGASAAPDDPADTALPAHRQALADDGKALPAAVADDGKPIDPALIWLPVGLPILAPAAPPLMLPPDPGARAPFAGAAGIDPGPATITAAVPLMLAPGVMEAKTDATMKELPVPAAGLPVKTDAGVTEPLSKTVAAAPSPMTAVPTAQPAGQTFAAAIAAVLANHEGPVRADDRADPRNTGALMAIAQADAAARPIVQAAGGAQNPALDLRDDRGLHGMIDRIEMLRDDANARDTRIRLVPDALGGVDVALRKDGDTLHVRFTADTQATRALLTEAQPRLAELADARGVKLGQTSVDTGAGGGANHANHQSRAAPRAPAPAAVPAADADFSTDQRLA
ncbi:flagellar hook-length control protein FliK [Sphingomonas sp. QA11]|uniref:flagellar hook-length control protein FliK n=1 Tax=Sphingomonas sp. QA11 TaxID=2950605 RepID=UPI00234947AE|nr:flagellar hook-length control protein FliK [Sphingomonas sp. QA11]WCM26616.1 flagellar hook-length control protein FliK [Sphingomonas sp. QA11]